MLFFFILFILSCKIEANNVSTNSLITRSYYDINYLDEILKYFSQNCIEKSTNTLNSLISLKKIGYTRSDIYALIYCICERGIKFENFNLELKKNNINRLSSYFDSVGCSYIEFKKRYYIFLNGIYMELKNKDFNLLEEVIKKYHSK
ncbi:MAG: hypothetical protein N2114_02055 [Candidatus Goldbacteria bacterium]|nr:hypothetical protein [Candidatus Goldiibacteriota bacterium]